MSASIFGWPGRSVRWNTMPEFSGRGLSVTVVFAPVWSPVPLRETGPLRVCCISMKGFLPGLGSRGCFRFELVDAFLKRPELFQESGNIRKRGFGTAHFHELTRRVAGQRALFRKGFGHSGLGPDEGIVPEHGVAQKPDLA